MKRLAMLTMLTAVLLTAPLALANDIPVTPTASNAAPAIAPSAPVVVPVIVSDGKIEPAPPHIVLDPGDHVESMIESAQKKEWGVFIGLGLMFLVWFVGLVWKAFPSAWLPYLSIGMGILSVMAVDLAQGKVWWRALLSGFTLGGAATGFWETFGKKFLGGSRSKKLKKKVEDAAAAKAEAKLDKADTEP